MIKKTKSLCPECFKAVDAEVYEENGKIMIKKVCDEHGEFINTYWSDADLYKRADEFSTTTTHVENPQIHKSVGCPNNCGLCEEHKSSTVLGLIDVTNRCNLRCPVCFANAAVSKRLYEPTQEEIRLMLQNLRNLKPVPTPAIQYAGGEPTVRRDLPELIAMAKEEGFTHTQIATNGLRLANKKGFAEKLKEEGLNTVYLQFDGVTEEPYINNRGKNLLPKKLEAIERCRDANLGMVLVPTLVKGVNDQQIGDIIKFAFDNRDIIYGVNFQPVAFAGRIDKDLVEKERFTIPDFQKEVTRQLDYQFTTDAFYPPSSVEPVTKFIHAMDESVDPVMLNCHQHCGSATYVFYDEDENGNPKYIPITDFIDVDGFLNFLDESAEKVIEGKFAAKTRIAANAIKNLPKFIDSDKAPSDLDIKHILFDVFKNKSYDALGEFSVNAMLISCMHFMDPYNFDEDRVQRCVIHYAVPDGRIIPFCTMNSRFREGVEKEFSVPLNRKEREKVEKLQEES